MSKKLNLIGKKFNRWTVLSEDSKRDRNGNITWKCKCKCGSIRSVIGAILKRGKSKSCGCLVKDVNNKNLINLVGKRFGHLKVIKFGEKIGRRHYWICKCDCGNEKQVRGVSLSGGNTKSCGCLNDNRLKTHGMSKTPIYRTYWSMKKRCSNKNNVNYGGRGITVCERWKMSFENFYQDMGDRPDNCSLDRINPDGNYEPSNCRWASKSLQTRNQEKNLIYEYNGIKLPLKLWILEIKTKGKLITE